MDTKPSKNNAQQGEILELSKDQILFQQGDVGGDLFFIQVGEIEIYSRSKEQEVTLSVMKPGEVIGVLTCMTREPRLAAARALTRCVVQRVRHEKLQRLVKSLPPWMRTVLREFTIRIAQMNKLYTEAAAQISVLKKSQITGFYTIGQMAMTFYRLADLKKQTIDQKLGVIPDEIIALIGPMLCRPQPEIEGFYTLLAESGLIVPEKVQTSNSANKSETCLQMTEAAKLQVFAAFVEQTIQGKNKKLIKQRMSSKEHKMLTALVHYVQVQKLEWAKPVKLAVPELKNSFAKIVEQEFDLGPVEQAAKLGIVTLEGSDLDMKVSFVPQQLKDMLAYLYIYRKLEKEPGG